MKYILEFNSFYKEGDVVIIEYWYNDMLTPVIIVDVISKQKFLVSHDVQGSHIKNAPDEVIKKSDIIDIHRDFRKSI
jgi:hypothetical protein